jgi:MoxR-like ATPase
LEEEDRILQDIDIINEPDITALITPEDIINFQREVRKVHVSAGIRRYILDIVNGVRHHQDVQPGPSPRASITLLTGTRALAFLQERDFVIPDDVKRLLVPALSHRTRIIAEAEMEDITPESIIKEVAAGVPVPKTDHE